MYLSVPFKVEELSSVPKCIIQGRGAVKWTSPSVPVRVKELSSVPVYHSG